ncbi:MAG TPA: phospholipase D-like domain-containing protein [Sphingorhabdus sp.]|jgi:phosphatidylserine/phosphatidylglycerophosphate/cardiolipin synthase-like enzyme|nr:phospholipase D-like domain-containing protein [Sphingorhabdus sp.]
MNPDQSENSAVWRFAKATRAHAVIDAADYFEIIQAAMMNAKHRIMLIGWDFDTRIDLTRSRRKKGAPPKRLGDFILWLADRNPNLEIKLLKWNIGALKMLGRGQTIVDVAKWAMHKQIQFKLDGAHPVGCSHHQKIVVIDDKMAACGGIDMTADRWDTRDHLDGDLRRKRPNGKLYGPWHDCTMLVEGEAAAALAELSRARWELAGGDPLEPCPADAASPWPEFLKAEYQFVEMGIARTRAEYEGASEIREIQHLFLEQIEKAKKFIYAENQYFASPRIADAIAKRMDEADPPEIVIVGPETADGWLEQKAMDGARAQLVRAIGEHDKKGRFHYYIPKTTAGESIYVHAKLMIVDDRILRIGSANMNNRSLGLDSECDIFIDCDRPGNESACDNIRALRASLLAEHIGLPTEKVMQLLDAGTSMREIIEGAKGNGPKLERLDLPELDEAEKTIADNAILDPENPDEMFEPFSSPGLFARVRKLRKPKR